MRAGCPGISLAGLLPRAQRSARDGEVSGREGRDVVLVGIGGRSVVLAAIDEMEANGLGVAVVCGAVDDDGLVGGGDERGGRLAEVGEEDVVPDGGAGGGSDVLDVEDVVFEVLVED